MGCLECLGRYELSSSPVSMTNLEEATTVAAVKALKIWIRRSLNIASREDEDQFVE